jgi:BCD family chlorophyll transporter-like MFS transporter
MINPFGQSVVRRWLALGPRYLPFADAATVDLPLNRLLRLSLFQLSVGMATVLLTGTLNRVMIVEMGVPTWLVALMVSLPLLFAPLRALIGFRSDVHRSAFGWRRVPFIWYGSVCQFGGLAIMPFALLVLTDAHNAPPLAGEIGAALAFLLVGAGIHTTQTAGLALATDLAPPEARPRVVALLYVMLLVGMLVAAMIFGFLLADFSAKRLIQVIQGAAVVTVALNLVAVWQQEARNPERRAKAKADPDFWTAWAALRADRRSGRLLVAVGLGACAFSMQDVLLEPYGGQILGLTVGATTILTAILAGGTLAGLALSARFLGRGMDPHRLAALGALVGIVAFSCVIFSAPFGSPALFRVGAGLIGFGGGLFSVALMIAAMDLADVADNGLALGAWGAVQASAAGLGLALGGLIRDTVGQWATSGRLGDALNTASTGYSVVYHLEILLLFSALVAVGPLVRRSRNVSRGTHSAFGLAEMPG